ncbi:MAG: right-handed parallel beta-helix repeat-containing protein [Candidatus Dependentiae bacterium]|nr:right-handed parallel beta-helix repeat-containing protein [Candidatus Dependentiae bacterium]
MKKILFIILFPFLIKANTEPDNENEIDIATYIADEENIRVNIGPLGPLPIQPGLPTTLPSQLTHPTPPTPPTPEKPQRPPTVWTQPLIIDANNHDFDHKSTVTFVENVVYKPATNYLYPNIYYNYPAAIIVAKDNITIDLAGFTLALDPSSASNFMVNSPMYGIAIYQGVKNVKIISSSSHEKKGTISGFSGFAIYMLGINQSYNNYDVFSNYIKNPTIDNILITQGINGIYMSYALQPTISNCDIIYNYSPRPLYGIAFSSVLNGNVDSCRINQNFSYSDIFGIYLFNTINVTVSSCQANVNRSLKNGNATGICITGTQALLNNGVGTIPTTSAANKISKCEVNQNLCANVDGATSIGINITTYTHHNAVEDCDVFLSGHSLLYPGNPAPPFLNPTQGIGIQINQSPLNQITGCRSGYHDTYGFYDNYASTPSPLPPPAPDITIPTSFWTKNIAILNGTFSNTPPYIPVGANYNVMVANSSGPIPPVVPLPTTVLTPDNLTAFTGSGPQLVNLEVKILS